MRAGQPTAQLRELQPGSDSYDAGPALQRGTKARLAALGEQRKILTVDMGGTSCDMAVSLDGEPEYTTRTTIGDFPLIRFFGDFEWLMDRRKVEFDFDQIAVFNFGRIDLPKGGAAKIGASTGLGSENNVDMVEKNKKPFFNWISADSEIATARGGGGGLALWRRDAEMEQEMRTIGTGADAESFQLPDLPKLELPKLPNPFGD